MEIIGGPVCISAIGCNRLKKTIEPANQITETSYDTAGNKTQVKFPDNTTQQWLYYDAFGQPGQFKDERQNVTDLVYWQWGPMKKQAQVKTYRAKDGGGTEEQLTAFWHDKMGRLTETIFPDGTYDNWFGPWVWPGNGGDDRNVGMGSGWACIDSSDSE